MLTFGFLKLSLYIFNMEEIWRDIKDYEGLYQVSNIVDCCNGKRNKTNGFKWEYYDTDKYLIALMNKNFKIKKVA